MEVIEVTPKDLFVGDEHAVEHNTAYDVQEYEVVLRGVNFRCRLVRSVIKQHEFVAQPMVYALSFCCRAWLSVDGECAACDSLGAPLPAIPLNSPRDKVHEWAWSLVQQHPAFSLSGSDALTAPLDLVEEFELLQGCLLGGR